MCAGFAPSAYSGYFRVAVEGQNVVMIARSATGIVSMVPNGTAYVDPNTLTDRGYPAYTKSQQSAYQYISLNAAGNVDWTLSGNQKISNYKLPSNAQFQFQHDVQLLPGSTVSLFNDACCAPMTKAR